MIDEKEKRRRDKYTRLGKAMTVTIDFAGRYAKKYQ